MNQSVNVMCNYVNRSGTAIDTSQMVPRGFFCSRGAPHSLTLDVLWTAPRVYPFLCPQVATAYALALGVSCSIAVSPRKLVESGGPGIKRLGVAVPYAAVVAAGVANVAFTRLPEMRSGVPISARNGTQLGVSKAAAQSAVVSTVISRNLLLPIASMLLPPLAMTAVRAALLLGPLAAVACELGLVLRALGKK